MTVIAWDGRYLAADRRGCRGDRRSIPLQKIRVLTPGSDVFGFCGTSALGQPWERWLMADPETRGLAPAKDECTVNVIRIIVAGDVFAYEYDSLGGMIVIPDGEAFALGSGLEYAFGAMAHGATAIEAVATASRYDLGCGDGCDFFDTHEPQRGIQRRE